jgi:hypothetical protein
MQRAVLIVSIVTLLALAATIAGQALVVTLGVTYTPTGQLVNPTPLATSASAMAGVGGILSFPLCLATFTLGLTAMILRRQYTWVAATIVAGLLGLVGLLGMAWVLLSANSPVAFWTPLVPIPLVTLFYSLRPASETAPGSGASS